jgi:predicted nuclease with TOPRIM domain
MSGGANFSGMPMIKLVEELREIQGKMDGVNEEINELKEKLAAMGDNQKKINDNQKRLDELLKKQNEFNKEIINKEISKRTFSCSGYNSENCKYRKLYKVKSCFVFYIIIIFTEKEKGKKI